MFYTCTCVTKATAAPFPVTPIHYHSDECIGFQSFKLKRRPDNFSVLLIAVIVRSHPTAATSSAIIGCTDLNQAE